MLENYVKKAGIGIALLCALASDCGIVATQRNYFRYEPVKNHGHLVINGYVPHKFKFYFEHPKQADADSNGKVEPKELKQYFSNLFNTDKK